MNTGTAEEDYASRIRSYVFDNFVLRGDARDVPIEESLVDTGIVDSYGIVELATWLENEFKITIQDDELVREHFGSIVLMSKFIVRKQQQAVGTLGQIRAQQ
jgi:acyl carrier protein